MGHTYKFAINKYSFLLHRELTEEIWGDACAAVRSPGRVGMGSVTLGMKAGELQLQGCQREELSESWVSLWHGDNHVGSDNGAGLGLSIHMVQPHTLGSLAHTESAFWISVSAFCPCLPLFGPLCR